MAASKEFFSGLDADGQTTPIVVDFGANIVKFVAWGTWGSGTLNIQRSPDGGTTWYNMKDAGGTEIALTVDGEVAVAVAYGEYVRASLSGSTSPDLQGRVEAANRG